MTTVFRPKLISTGNVMMVALALGLTLLYWPVLHTYFFPSDFRSAEPIFQEIAIVMIGSIAVIWLIALGIIINFTARKAWFERNSLFFSSAGLPRWRTSEIDLSRVNLISSKVTHSSNGKTIIPVLHFLFEKQNNEIQDVVVSGWDKTTLKEILLEIKQRFPKIKIDTTIYRESSLELSGLSEYMTK